jgi:hypothetical protein
MFNFALVCRQFKDIAERRMYESFSNVNEKRSNDDPLHSLQLGLFEQHLDARPEIRSGFKSVKLGAFMLNEIAIVFLRLRNISTFTYVHPAHSYDTSSDPKQMSPETVYQLLWYGNRVEQVNLSYDANMSDYELECHARGSMDWWEVVFKILLMPNIQRVSVDRRFLMAVVKTNYWEQEYPQNGVQIAIEDKTVKHPTLLVSTDLCHLGAVGRAFILVFEAFSFLKSIRFLLDEDMTEGMADELETWVIAQEKLHKERQFISEGTTLQVVRKSPTKCWLMPSS